MTSTCPADRQLQLAGADTLTRGLPPSRTLLPMAALLENLAMHPEAVVHFNPGWKLADGLLIVRAKLGRDEYTNGIEECADDVRMICRKAWAYNGRHSTIGTAVSRLSAWFEQKLAAVQNSRLSADVGAGEKVLKGTLIVAPQTILQQWVEEIGRHAPGLRVEVYSGVHTIASVNEKGYVQLKKLAKIAAVDGDETAGERLREEARQKRLVELCKADVVLTTYQALQKEVHYFGSAGDGGSTRRMRHKKRYAAPTCPLLAHPWHRVVLDEVLLYTTQKHRKE